MTEISKARLETRVYIQYRREEDTVGFLPRGWCLFIVYFILPTL